MTSRTPDRNGASASRSARERNRKSASSVASATKVHVCLYQTQGVKSHGPAARREAVPLRNPRYAGQISQIKIRCWTTSRQPPGPAVSGTRWRTQGSRLISRNAAFWKFWPGRSTGGIYLDRHAAKRAAKRSQRKCHHRGTDGRSSPNRLALIKSEVEVVSSCDEQDNIMDDETPSNPSRPHFRRISCTKPSPPPACLPGTPPSVRSTATPSQQISRRKSS